MKQIVLYFCTMILPMFCVACSFSSKGSFDTIQSIQPLPTVSQNKFDLPQTDEFPYNLYFPMPYFRVFSDEIEVDNIDAFLHNTATNYYCSAIDASAGTLLAVSLQLLDQWEDDSGSTYYLCFMAEYDFYNLAEELAHNYVVPDSTVTTGGILIRFKVLIDNAHKCQWGFQLQEIVEEPVAYSDLAVRDICNHRPIADEIIEFKNGNRSEVTFIRYLLPEEYAHNRNAILKHYLEVYFPNCFEDKGRQEEDKGVS